MNPHERYLAALRGQKADRVPLELAGFLFPSREEIAQLADPLRRTIAERVHDQTHFEFQVPSHINRMLVTPPQRIRATTERLPGGGRRTRGAIDTPKGNLTYETQYNPVAATSWHVKYPVENEDDIEKIASVPWELPANLAPLDLSRPPKGRRERGIVTARISSPFVCVAGMMNYQSFLAMTATHAELILELTEICRRRILDCLQVLLSRPGIECVWMGGSEWVTPPMGSPALYDALVQEQERSLIQFIHEHSDAVVHVHCHGRVRDALPKVIERGGDYLEPVEAPPDGDITMADAKRLAVGRITLGGNIECRILCNDSEQRVERAVRAAFEGGKERFVLRPTEGPSPLMSEREFRNYTSLVDLWKKLSPIESSCP